MTKMPMWRRYLRFFGSDVKEDVEEELRFHLESKAEELVARGWSREEAEAAARREFGDLARVRDACEQLQERSEKRRKRVELFTGLRHDVVYGLRQLGRRWPTTILAVATLGIGIGAVAAVFGILYAVVLRPLPFPEPGRIVTIWSTREGHTDVATPLTFESWRRDTKSFASLAALQRNTFTFSDGGSAIQVTGGEITSNFFTVFGVSPAIGSAFTALEDKPPRQHLVILSDRLWRERFAADHGIIGRAIHLDRETYTVIGVMPRRFDLRPDGEQLWIPLALGDQEMHWAGGVLDVFGRLRPNVSLSKAQAEMDVESRILQARYPEMNRGTGSRVDSFAASLVGGYSRQLWILLAAVGSVFLIACANVANLLMARTAGRTRELTVRAALGASRTRILRQLLTESLLLGMAGSTVGLGVAAAAIRIAKSIGASAVPRLSDAGVNGWVLVALVGLGVICTLLAGALPAWRAARLNPQSAMAQGERSASGLARDKSRDVYIAFEAGLALVLLVAAGLLIRTAIAAQDVRPGFDPGCVVTGRTALPPDVYATAGQIAGTYQRILEGLATEPGVRAAALTSRAPLTVSTMGILLKRDAVSPALREQFSVDLQYVSPGYFAAMRIPVRRGREFNRDDGAHSMPVALMNAALAHRLWPGRNAVGEQLRLPEFDSETPNREIVGVVANAHDNGLMAPSPAVLYVPIAQVPINPWHWARQSLYLVARTPTEALAKPELLRSAIEKVDAGLPLGDALTMRERLAQSISAARLYTLLLSALGLCALMMTAAGIYGVVAYFVSRQRAEIGIRMALGATRAQVLLFVVRQGMRPVLAGMIAGIAAALVVSRALASQVFGVSVLDPFTFAAVAGILLGAALFACYLPAHQAARIDPMAALRSE